MNTIHELLILFITSKFARILYFFTGEINDLSGISLALIGVSGVGKTAMMAKLAYELSSSELLPSLPVIVRFCGTSKGIADGFELVTSIL